MSAIDPKRTSPPRWHGNRLEHGSDRDRRPEVNQKAKEELLARLTNTKKQHLVELVAMKAERSKPANK